MIKIRVGKTELHFIRNELLTCGSRNAFKVRFTFDDEIWNGLKKIAAFQSGETVMDFALDDKETAVIPWEVLQLPGEHLYIAVAGYNGTDTILTTEWIDAGEIHLGMTNTLPGDPSPSIYEQLLKDIGVLSNLTTDTKENLVAAINEVDAEIDAIREDPPVYIPAVSEEGELSWTNNYDLDNPDPVNIKGDAGDVAEDSEVSDMLDDVFGEGGEPPDEQIATDEEVSDMLENVFGDIEDAIPDNMVATDTEVNNMLDSVFD